MRRPLLLIGSGIIVGVTFFTLVRIVFMPSVMATHFHANFAVFIDGKQFDFSADKYMEDVQGCKPDYIPLLPQERTHLHNNEGHVLHVHERGVTWGHFFANIGFDFGKTYLVTDEGTLYVNGNKTIKFILNGESVESPFNKLIGNEDQLLISYGVETVEGISKTQFPSIANDAHEHNEHPDPGSCSGAIELDFWGKVKKAVWY
jgi:hypothetical protein